MMAIADASKKAWPHVAPLCISRYFCLYPNRNFATSQLKIGSRNGSPSQTDGTATSGSSKPVRVNSVPDLLQIIAIGTIPRRAVPPIIATGDVSALEKRRGFSDLTGMKLVLIRMAATARSNRHADSRRLAAKPENVHAVAGGAMTTEPAIRNNDSIGNTSSPHMGPFPRWRSKNLS